MSKQRTLSLFSLSTPHGSALQQQIEHLISSLDFKLNMPSHPTIGNVAAACFNEDVVIFDGSIEEEGHNYEIAYEQLKRLEYAFIVSRSPLPLNFLGLRPGVAPAYPHSLSNDAILRRLRQVLPTMTKRLWSEKGVLFHLKAQSRSIDWETQQRKEQSQIFISYRSRYSSQVKLLQERLHEGKFHEGQLESMAFFPPGSLAFEDEIMSAMRRWQILCIIREYIADCEEFWIYQTEDYLDSWWTRGELATLVYFGGAGRRRVRAYNASSNTVRDITGPNLQILPVYRAMAMNV